MSEKVNKRNRKLSKSLEVKGNTSSDSTINVNKKQENKDIEDINKSSKEIKESAEQIKSNLEKLKENLASSKDRIKELVEKNRVKKPAISSIPKPLAKKPKVDEKEVDSLLKEDATNTIKRLSAGVKHVDTNKLDLKSIPNNEKHRLFSSKGLINREEFVELLNSTFDEFMLTHPDFFTAGRKQTKKDEDESSMLSSLLGLIPGAWMFSKLKGLMRPLNMIKAAFKGIMKPIQFLLTAMIHPIKTIKMVWNAVKSFGIGLLNKLKKFWQIAKYIGDLFRHPSKAIKLFTELLSKGGKAVAKGAKAGYQAIKTGAKTVSKGAATITKKISGKIASGGKAVAKGVSKAPGVATVLAAGEGLSDLYSEVGDDSDPNAISEAVDRQFDKHINELVQGGKRLPQDVKTLFNDEASLSEKWDAFSNIMETSSKATVAAVVDAPLKAINESTQAVLDVVDKYRDITKESRDAKIKHEAELNAAKAGLGYFDINGQFHARPFEIKDGKVVPLPIDTKKIAEEANAVRIQTESDRKANQLETKIWEKDSNTQVIATKNNDSVTVVEYKPGWFDRVTDWSWYNKDNLRKTKTTTWGTPSNDGKDIYRKTSVQVTIDDSMSAI